LLIDTGIYTLSNKFTNIILTYSKPLPTVQQITQNETYIYKLTMLINNIHGVDNDWLLDVRKKTERNVSMQSG